MPSGKTFVQLSQEWAQVAIGGALLTPKHDPNASYQQNVPIRSVVSQQLSSSLESFIVSKNYTVDEYYNPVHNNYYYVVTPDPSLGFNVAGYYMLSGSQATGSALNSMIMVSGSTQGWHIFTEASATIAQKMAAGELVYEGKL
jgi:hypothetical protein